MSPLSRATIQLLISNEVPLADAILARLAEISPSVSSDAAAQAALRIPRAMRSLFAGNPEPYMRDGDAIVQVFEAAGDRRYASVIGIQLSVACVVAGEYARGVRHAEYAIDVGVRMGLPPTVVRATATLSLHLAYLDRFDKATRAGLEARDEAAALDDRVSEAQARVALAFVHFRNGDFAAAETEARALADGSQYPPMFRAEACGLLARILATRHPSEALSFARRAAAFPTDAAPTAFGTIQLGLIEALRANGEEVEARETIARAHELLLARVARIESSDLRRSILERIPEHARIVELRERLA